MPTRHSLIVCLAVIALALMSASARVHAQGRGANVTVRGGFASGTDEFQTACGTASLAFSADVQGRGRVFPQISYARMTGSGGADIACIPVNRDDATAVGGLRLDGATQGAIGIGSRSEDGPMQLEAVALAGLVAGHPGFGDSPINNHRERLPQIGGQASVIFGRVFVLSLSAQWTRLTLRVTPKDGRAGYSRINWKPLKTMSAGVRIRLGSTSR